MGSLLEHCKQVVWLLSNMPSYQREPLQGLAPFLFQKDLTQQLKDKEFVQKLIALCPEWEKEVGKRTIINYFSMIQKELEVILELEKSGQEYYDFFAQHNIPELKDAYAYPRPIGDKRIVFDIAPGLVAKVGDPALFSWIHVSGMESIYQGKKEEFEIQKDLFENGIQVPRPVGIFFFRFKSRFNLRDRFGRKRFTLGFVMQKCEGYPMIMLQGSERDEAERQFSEQIKKAKTLGYEPGDYLWHMNNIWVRSEKKLYIIDVAKWRKQH
jgi:hypothetical protein